MHPKKHRGVVWGALVCSLTGTGVTMGEVAPSDVQSQMETLKAEVAQLRAANQDMKGEVDQMRAAKGETWLNERRAQEVKALVKEVLADADTRASMLGSGAVAGHNGKNFFLASEDGKFLLKIGSRIQARYVANFRNDSDAAGGASAPDDTEMGFQIRRMKTSFEGHIGSPKFEYRIVLAADRNSNTVALEEAAIAHLIADGLKITGGRYKAPFLHEELISSGKQQAVERSVFNEVFTTGFTEGVGLTWTPTDMIRLGAMINDGQNAGEISTGRQPVVSSAVSGNDFSNDLTDIALTGRVDVKLMGDWKQWEEFAAWAGEDTALFLGAAVHYEQGETGSNTTPTKYNNSFFQWTGDVLFKTGGFNFFAAAAGRYDHSREGSNSTSGLGGVTAGSLNFCDYGFEAQAGYMVIPDKLEPFVRYEYISLDGDRGPNVDEVNIITVGANYYFSKHNAKFTLDVVWALDPLTADTTADGGNAGNVGSTSLSGLGLLNDAVDQDDQIAVRAQFQLQF